MDKREPRAKIAAHLGRPAWTSAGKQGWRFVLGLESFAGRAAKQIAAWARDEMEARRLFLWIPVAIGVGVIAYFAAEGEPNPLAPSIGAVVFALGAFVARQRIILRLALIAGLCAMVGFLAATVRTRLVHAPKLERVTIAIVAGFVEQVDFRAQGARLVIRPTSIGSLAAADLPRRIRVTSRERPALKAGDHVTMRARLLPPPGPALPGGYDFGRDAYFRGVGAVGSVFGAPVLTATSPPMPILLGVFAWIDRARNALTDRIASTIGGQSGALAAALVTGKRELLEERTNENLRAAGIYHIVSISGLHMVLAAGTIFWTLRIILVLLVGAASTFPAKKAAALGAMFGATAYCIFTGADVATERSLIMILIMLGAIVADRPALSMRNLALAAIVVLLFQPETLIGPSFQMSFAAVAGLVAYAEWSRRRDGDPDRLARHWPVGLFAWRLIFAFWIILVTTIIASLATAPYAAYHFQRINPLGLIGNALTLPIVSLVVMPAATAGVIAYPFGLDRPIWATMGLGVAPILQVAEWVAGFAGSVTAVSAFGPGALSLICFGFLWIVLWRTPLRLAGLVPLAIGLMGAGAASPPDILVARDGAGAALRFADGRIALVGHPSRFDVEAWLRALGDKRKATDPALKSGVACDGLGCVARLADGRAIAVLRDPQGLAEDCRRAAIVVTPLSAPEFCRPLLLIDRKVIEKSGAIALRRAGTGFAVTVSRGETGARRPWEPRATLLSGAGASITLAPDDGPSARAARRRASGQAEPAAPNAETDENWSYER